MYVYDGFCFEIVFLMSIYIHMMVVVFILFCSFYNSIINDTLYIYQKCHYKAISFLNLYAWIGWVLFEFICTDIMVIMVII